MKSKMHPESLMMSHGYKPELSEGAIKPPVFQTSTFAFDSAEAGKAFFEVAYGLRAQDQDEETGLIYSRINNPNLQIFEERLCLWDEADQCAVFESGMSAISTVLLEFLKPGDLLLYSMPTYGGTDHFITHYLQSVGVHALGFRPDQTQEEIIQLLEASGLAKNLALIYIETPANPTNELIDIAMCKALATRYSTAEKAVYLAVDNTYMGPIWCSPLKHGADLVIYSATKYIGGHSDLIAGAVLGSNEIMQRVKVLRTFLGNMASPHTCWLLLRSLETLKVRMEQQARSAQEIALFLEKHPKVSQVYYLGTLKESTEAYSIYKRQYTSPGAMIAFDIKGAEAEAFRLLNKLNLIKLAVSLGSTESLVQHPDTMTHAGVNPELKKRMGITSSLIRLSVGVENHEDLITDLEAGLECV
ncbi:cystathionine gamma-synthase family protein [Leeuwenhoekiella sp. MAR_2009_132]|uniref:cystathionine gamma-synthase family protein n=1 Tax=Leeuwenhoekiella sp. MAR_2009_132 TaxID=1392489 RepID=UPI00048DE458|nr:cystathionine gamma-synthase family protein [Leeuwenhoekiella sp. MAR_2009_132]